MGQNEGRTRRPAWSTASRRWPAVALVTAVVLGAASSGGAQVDPRDPSAPAVWAASCVNPDEDELVVYGRGFVPGPVTVDVATGAAGQAQVVVGGATATAADGSAGGAFQARIALSGTVPGATLRLRATQPGRTAEHAVQVAPTCGLALAAVINAIPCALPGRPVNITVTVRGAPSSAFDLLLHHADLYGPAEAINRDQPATRPADGYAFPLGVANVPDRTVPVTVEARRTGGDGAMTYATTDVTLPPACSPPNTTTPATSPPTTTAPPAPGSTTTPSTSPGPVATLPATPFRPVPGSAGGAPASIAVSPAVGRAGETTTVSGRGFAPSATVTLRWRPGIGEWVVAVGGDGTFRTQVLVLPNDAEGPRVLEVVEAAVPPARYLVVPGSDQPAFGGVFVRS